MFRRTLSNPESLTPQKRNRRLTSLLLAASIALAGCSSGDSDKEAPSTHDKGTGCLASDLEGRLFSHILDVPGESFKIRATYSTDYDVASWKITDTKTLDIKLELVSEPSAAPTVLVENLHADAVIKANRAGLNGMKQDSFDDHLHTGSQPGFQVSADHPYSERFVIEGYSETLISGWGFQVSGTGSMDISETRLTEKNLREKGAYGEQITMVTDLLVKGPQDPFFHKTVIGDGLLVPLQGFSC